jgi:hypothetical protein
MAYLVVKRPAKKKYYYLVKSFREGKKVRQRVLKYFGTEPPSPEKVERLKKELGK